MPSIPMRQRVMIVATCSIIHFITLSSTRSLIPSRLSSADFHVLVMPSTSWTARSAMPFAWLSPLGEFSGTVSPFLATLTSFHKSVMLFSLSDLNTTRPYPRPSMKFTSRFTAHGQLPPFVSTTVLHVDPDFESRHTSTVSLLSPWLSPTKQ